MKFGKEFRIHLEETLPEWRDKFLCYKPLKMLLKRFPATATAVDSLPPNLAFLLHPNHQLPAGTRDDHGNPQLVDLQGWFVRILNEELEKFNDFYIDKEEEFVIRFQVQMFLHVYNMCVYVLSVLCVYVYIWVPYEMGNF